MSLVKKNLKKCCLWYKFNCPLIQYEALHFSVKHPNIIFTIAVYFFLLFCPRLGTLSQTVRECQQLTFTLCWKWTTFDTEKVGHNLEWEQELSLVSEPMFLKEKSCFHFEDPQSGNNSKGRKKEIKMPPKLFPLWRPSKWKQLGRLGKRRKNWLQSCFHCGDPQSGNNSEGHKKREKNASLVVSTLETLNMETTWEAGKRKKKMTSELFPLWRSPKWKQLFSSEDIG